MPFAQNSRKKASEAWRQKRKESDSEERNSPSSKVPWTSLQKKERSALAKWLHSKWTSREAKIKRMERQIKEFEEDVVIQDETLEMMSNALDKCQKNPKDLKKSLEVCFEMMINVKVKDGNDSDALLSMQDTQNCRE